MEAIILTHEQHVNEIMRRARLHDIDAASADIMFDEQLRLVDAAMWEPQPSEKRHSYKLAAIALNCLLWIPLAIICVEIFRP